MNAADRMARETKAEELAGLIAKTVDRQNRRDRNLTVGTILAALGAVSLTLKRAAPEVTDMPTKVRIGALDFAIEDWSPQAAAVAGSFGQTVMRQQLIRIDRSHTPRMVADTMLHEIMHAIWWGFGLGEQDKEERIVSMMATAMVCVWRDNPEVFDWIASQVATPTA